MADLRIIVADDNPAFLREVTSLLAAEFDVVATATDGRSALDLIRRYMPDLAVLDLGMPGLNGIEVMQELAKSSQDPPIVICSVETDSCGGCTAGRSVGLCLQTTGRKGFDLGCKISSSGQILCVTKFNSITHL